MKQTNPSAQLKLIFRSLKIQIGNDRIWIFNPFYSLDFDCFWQRLGINYKQGMDINRELKEFLFMFKNTKPWLIVISEIVLEKGSNICVW